MNRQSLKPIELTILLQIITVCVCYSQTKTISVENGKNLTLLQTIVETVDFEGKNALKVMTDTNGEVNGLVILEGIEFQNGTIEFELAGKPKKDAPAFAKGFIGLAFHIQDDDPSRYEAFYLRPVNAVADNETQRNRSVQYISHPDYPWNRLREESPGQYESFGDCRPGEWTKIKMAVKGSTAALFVNDMDSPCLTVNDLKHGERGGPVAFWLHSTTEAYFRNVIITR